MENSRFSIDWGKFLCCDSLSCWEIQSAFWTCIWNHRHYENMFQQFGGTNFIVQRAIIILYKKIKICEYIHYSKKNSWQYIILSQHYLNVRSLLLYILARRLVMKYRRKKWLKENSNICRNSRIIMDLWKLIVNYLY